MSGTYSFNDVVASITAPGGITIPFGYGQAVADEGIDLTPAGDKNTMTVAADGQVMHSLHADQSGLATVRLLKISPVNALLMALYDLQTISSVAHGQNSIAVAHVVSGDLHTGSRCAFKKKPTIKYSKDGDILVWEWDVGNLNSVLGTY